MSPLDQVRWLDLPSVDDERGVLTAVESGCDIPFEIKRLFLVHHVKAPRGGHAHRDTDQVVTAAYGSFDSHLFDGKQTLSFRLDDPRRGLYLPRMIFIEMENFHPGTVALVIANTHYDKGQSLRTRDAYLQALDECSNGHP